MAAWLGASPVSAKEVFRVGGSGDGTIMLAHLLKVYSEANDTGFEIELNVGSRGGIRAVLDGALDLAVSGRQLNAEEVQSGLEAIPVALTPYVLVTSTPNPNGLRSADIPSIFAGEKTFWGNGEQIRIILRPRNQSSVALLRTMFPTIETAFAKARGHTDVPVAATDDDNMLRARQIPGSLTWMSLARFDEVESGLKLVDIDGVKPSLQSFESGSYPYGRPFYFVTRTQKTAALSWFIAFVQSPDGAKVLRETSALPILK
jgi:phosphate transport system substrate-binding protein